MEKKYFFVFVFYKNRKVPFMKKYCSLDCAKKFSLNKSKYPNIHRVDILDDYYNKFLCFYNGKEVSYVETSF